MTAFPRPEDRPAPQHSPRTDEKQNALIKQLDAHLITHEEALLEMILLARQLEDALTFPSSTQSPAKHMDADGSTVSHEAWLEADDRTKAWYSIPLYAHPSATLTPGWRAVPEDEMTACSMVLMRVRQLLNAGDGIERSSAEINLRESFAALENLVGAPVADEPERKSP